MSSPGTLQDETQHHMSRHTAPSMEVVMNVTTDSFRHFAKGCLQWAAASNDAGSRHAILREAMQWAKTADLIDTYVAGHKGTALPDLRSKLN